ncbi:hypothetical protein PRCB_13045 [Pantoea rodasii]|uniref:Uncharacterized protein n=1 Tax=Pantoea rodasii TaxID=1076549 RepID=A0A2M9WC74_9GAMM|nr:hypothetical protein HA45_21720 [Pantoea rodasii]PJZ05124.1 hypothetical protein PRCB_13045 [Pantoea rodasii]
MLLLAKPDNDPLTIEFSPAELITDLVSRTKILHLRHQNQFMNSECLSVETLTGFFVPVVLWDDVTGFCNYRYSFVFSHATHHVLDAESLLNKV